MNEEIKNKLDKIDLNLEGKSLFVTAEIEKIKSDNEVFAAAIESKDKEMELVKAENLSMSKKLRDMEVENQVSAAIVYAGEVELELVKAEAERNALENAWTAKLTEIGIPVVAKRLAGFSDQGAFDEYVAELTLAIDLGKKSVATQERTEMTKNQELVLAHTDKSGLTLPKDQGLGKQLGKMLVDASKGLAKKSR
jgi:hypothetical protein